MVVGPLKKNQNVKSDLISAYTVHIYGGGFYYEAESHSAFLYCMSAMAPAIQLSSGGGLFIPTQTQRG